MPDGGYILPAVIAPENSVYVCIPVPDDVGHRQAFAGALLSLARWWSWQRDDDETGTAAAAVWWGIWLDVMAQMDQRFTDCGGIGQPCPNAGECVYSSMSGWCAFYDDCCCFGEDDEMPIIKLGGIAYLINNCGCGDTELYRLDRATVEVDNDTGDTKVLLLDVTDKGAGKDYDFPVVADGNQACYAEKAVEYLLGRAWEYHQVWEEILAIGVDNLLGSLDEWLDVGGLISQILTGVGGGVIEATRGWSTADLQDAFESQDFIDGMVASWTYSGAVTRDELNEWAQTAPVYLAVDDQSEIEAMLSGIRMRELLAYWVRWSLINGYNDDLQILAAECETGRTLADIVETYYQEIKVNGDTYPTWTFHPNLVDPGPGEWQPDVPDLQAIAAVWTISGTSGTVDTRLFKKNRNWLAVAMGMGEKECVVTGNTDAKIAAELAAGRSFTTQGGAGTFSYPSFQRQSSTGDAIVTLDLVVCVGAAL